jgi:hypothetical protein
VLPDEVLFRKKSWSDAVASNAWRRRGRVLMLRAVPGFPRELDELGPGTAEAVEFWEPHSILASSLSLWFFREIFVGRAAVQPPAWEDLVPRARAAPAVVADLA